MEGKLKRLIVRVMNMFLLKNTLDSLGIRTAASEAMSGAAERWGRMYTSQEGLRLSAAIASETARLVTLEMKCKIEGSERAHFLDGQFDAVREEIRAAAEYACADGGVILKPYVSGGKIEVACVRAGSFIPTCFDASGEITGAAFLDRRYRDGKVYTRIEQHIAKGGGYTVKNLAFMSENDGEIGKRVPLESIEEWADIKAVTRIEGLKRPLFSYFKMPMANTVDASSPLGVSVYARAENLIDDADRQYERLLWEFKSGERAVMADAAAFRMGDDGQRELPDERLYVALEQEDLFKEWSPALREQGILRGLDEILRRIEFNTGLAYGTLSNVQNTDKTAEEIRSSKQRSYAHIADIQASLKRALCSLADAMDILCDLYKLCAPGKYELSAEFDDSIIADRRSEFDERRQLAADGIMTKEEFRMWYFGEDERTAEQMVKRCGAATEQ